MPEEFFGKEKKTDENYNTQQKPTEWLQQTQSKRAGRIL